MYKKSLGHEMEIASAEIIRPVFGGKTAVIFRNHKTGKQEIKVYNTERGARSEITKFLNRCCRIYCNH